MPPHALASLGGLICLLLGILCAPVAGQVANLDRLSVPIRVHSGSLTNDTNQEAVIFSHLVTLPGAASMQLRFGRTNLPTGSVLRMTSIRDGARQHHRGLTLRQWQGRSAWFNGNSVLIELVAQPGIRAHVTIEDATYLQLLGGDRSICGNTDDRVPSDDPKSGRVFPVGCTGWLIDDPNHTFLSAGHCFDDQPEQTMQFNVPFSDGDGNWQHPGPEDQYAIDPVSLQYTVTTIGNDWSYYGCFPNTETGLTPYQAQNDFFMLADAAPPVDGQDITITGFGVTYSGTDPTWNLAQKVHTGPYDSLEGTIIRYVTDTSGGNSGSAVFDEASGQAIGIHTNAGCTGSGGANHGCAIHNAGLQNALANPLGVCLPNTLQLSFPDGRPNSVLPGTPFDLDFIVTSGDEDPVISSIKLVLTIDGQTQNITPDPLGKDVYRAAMPGFLCDQNVSFYLSAQGHLGGQATLPYGAPDDQFFLAVGEYELIELFQESFDTGIPAGWSTSGLWHGATDACANGASCQGGDVAYFGQDSGCSYETGGTAEGALTSPALSLDGIASTMTLSFCYQLNTEQLQGYDIASVHVNGVQVAQLAESADWQATELALSGVSGDTITVSWQFNSVDNIYNDYIGFHVDDVRLIASSIICDPTEPCPGDADGSGSVETNDLLLVIKQWGQAGGSGDVNGDGIVNTDDILLVIQFWGPC